MPAHPAGAHGIFERIFNYSNDAIFLMDPEGNCFLDVNPKACSRLGYTRDELISLPISAVHPKEMPRLLAFAQSVFDRGHGWTSEFTCLTKSGERLPSEVSASFIDVNRRPVLIAMVRDISDRKRVEDELRQLAAALEQRVEERTAMLRQSEDRQKALLEVNNAIIANLDRDALFEAVTRSLQTILPLDVAVICLLDNAANTFKLFALHTPTLSRSAFPLGAEMTLPNTHVAWVIEHHKPLLRRDLASFREFAIEEQLLAAGICSYIAVPLIGRTAILGTLNIGSRAADHYTDEDASFFADFGKQVALALENMLAHEEIIQLKGRLESENTYLQEEIKIQHNFEEIIGQSPAIRKVQRTIETVAPTGANVMILGETGTGKELVARAVHNLSGRRSRALIKVNCAAIPSGLVESELFGHEKGAFTGALTQKIGRFELADKGTIFLDEIGEMPMELQPKLLRVLQEGEFERVGGARTLKVDVRVIAATNRDLEEAVHAGRFREDLYYRLNVFPITLPPLRDRREDITLLTRYFVVKHSARLGKTIEQIPRETTDYLRTHSWPGNIRELENVIERAVILSRGPNLELCEPLIRRARPGPDAPPLLTLEELEREHIAAVLRRVSGRVSGNGGAAEILGMKPTTLESRMKKLGVSRVR